MSERLAIGIDMGGTKVAGAIVDPDLGVVVHETVMPTGNRHGGRDLLNRVVAMQQSLSRLAATRGATLVATGVGVPELVDQHGQLHSFGVGDWRDIDIDAEFGTPATIVSDVVAGAVAEARFGAGHGVSSFLYVSIGTGCSSTFVIGGQPWHGANHNALVLASGSIAYPTEDGRTGDYVPEEYCSGAGLERLYRQADPNGVPLDARDIISRIETDAAAANAVAVASSIAGSLIAGAINMLDPGRVVLGGGLGSSQSIFCERLISEARSRIWAPASRTVEIETAALGRRSGMVGAALMAVEASPVER